jgi:uncharacterized protein YfaT (DUF1175 family)
LAFSGILLLAFAAASITISLGRPGHGKPVRARAAALESQISFADSAGDGTPDFLRLDSSYDREAFRRWFSFLAEVQYFSPSARPAEIVDCAALVRYAFREALRRHDSAWAASARLVLAPGFGSIEKYSFPHTPLGPALFRLRPGPFLRSDIESGAFGQFANAESLYRFNTFFVSREFAAAQRGDLLFFRRPTERMPFHTMIFIAGSQIAADRNAWVVYHTGPNADDPGEIRRLSATELLRFPDPQWRPITANPYFLGIYRWNILRSAS